MIYYLDGRTTGIAVKVTYKNTKKHRFIVTKENKIRLFDNLEVAKTVAKTVTGIESKIDYYISVNDKMYPLDKIYKVHGVYKIIDKDTQTIISVKEKTEYKASKFGYIVFEDGDTTRCEKKYGHERNDQLMNSIAAAIELAFIENRDEFGVAYTESYNSEFVIHLRNCTGAIHICTNGNLMDINQCRKEEGLKVFPFSKNMDKFTTFYTYISRDASEPSRVNSEEKALKLLDRLLTRICEMEPDANAKVVNIEYGGYICYEI